jgi:hypothetical protein
MPETKASVTIKISKSIRDQLRAFKGAWKHTALYKKWQILQYHNRIIDAHFKKIDDHKDEFVNLKDL